MDKHIKANRTLWDDWAGLHVESKAYDVKGFKRNPCRLPKVELEEVGDVAGKSLLHLQCHFGLDTLSWAKQGAKVTGTDFSEKAVALAKSLADELNIPAEFICANLYDLPKVLTGQFDIVFTSKGVLCWLPDLREWAQVIAHFLKPGGIFYIHEFHPFAGIFDNDEKAKTPTIRYPYFHSDPPMRFEGAASYAASNPDGIRRESFEWSHSLADVLSALLAADLRIEFLHEFPYCTYQSHLFLTKGEDGLWRYPGAPAGMPLMFSLKAVKLGAVPDSTG